MKASLTIICILACSLSNRAQDSGVRERLLASEGNIKVSKLFNEAPALPIDDREAEIYRITIIPTFYNLIKIRVEKRQTNYVLIAKRSNGQGGFDAGKLKTEKRRSLKPAEWEHLIDLLKKADF